MQSEHTYKQYDAELEAVRAKVLKMGGLVEQQIVSALESLVNVNPKLAAEVIRPNLLVTLFYFTCKVSMPYYSSNFKSS